MARSGAQRSARALVVVGIVGAGLVLTSIPTASTVAAFPEIPNYCNAWTTGASQVLVANNYRRFTFTADGTFTTPNTVAMPVKMFIMGGGGGGGAGGIAKSGGGGGGGAALEYLETDVSLEAGTAYTITIGQGGAGSTSLTQRGASGTSTIVAGGSQHFEATGGAGGGSGDSSAASGASGTIYSGMPAGSSAGGGGSYNNSAQTGGTGATSGGNGGTGNAGSGNASQQETRRTGGGGGGASPTAGSNASNSKGGNGGSGESNSDATNVSVTYGGGGGGGGRTSASTGGSGGGGAGGIDSADPAVYNGADANTTGGVAGGGGGGGANSATIALTSGGAGARGTVVIAYKDNYTCPRTAPTGTPGVTGVVASNTAVLSWTAPTTFVSPQAVASYTVVYYLPGGTSSGNIYAKGGPVTPRTINISGATESACESLNAGWDCSSSLSLSGATGVTFKVFARTTVGGVGKLTAASSPSVSYP